MVEHTSFTKDVIGRYVCNTFQEAVTEKANGHYYDIIIVGSGMYGGTLAHYLKNHSDKKILLIEAGHYTFSEHVTSLPSFGNIYSPVRSSSDKNVYGELWGTPWNGDIETSGLAYTVGGRSLYWGGWVPRALETELGDMPFEVCNDLYVKYYKEAELLVGATDPTDYIRGELHRKLLDRTLTHYGTLNHAVPLDELPSPYEFSQNHKETNVSYLNEYQVRLEPPVAVYSDAKPGSYGVGKFNTVSLLIEAAREAYHENPNNKQLTILPATHVNKLEMNGSKVVGVNTNRGQIWLKDSAKVVLGASPIETARIALLSFGVSQSYPQMGKGLMSHGMLTTGFEMSRKVYADLMRHELSPSIQILRFRQAIDGVDRHFQVQVFVSGRPGGSSGGSAFEELDRFEPTKRWEQYGKYETDEKICVTLMGFIETVPDENSRVDLSSEWDEHNFQRAHVTFVKNQTFITLMDSMRDSMIQVARLLNKDADFLNLNFTETPPIATHHECGTMRMGTDPQNSCVDEHQKVHYIDNAYVCDMSVLPAVGAFNPALTGIALTLRLGDHLKGL